MRILKSAEDYLETIFILKKQLGEVRSIDVVNHLKFSKPSVSIAMKTLRENDYIIVNSLGYISLTEKGLEIAVRVSEKHHVLIQFLMALGVSEESAKEDACKIEHDISEESYAKLKSYYMTHLIEKASH
ncbi:MAG: metal-dependent transcriptional regulator [Peptococcaceae bacterium]|nr:metal-dependent transcriptional regulator [Peptococcaceae bacterium]